MATPAVNPSRPCPLCGASSARLLLTIAPPAAPRVYHVVACTDCGLRYTDPLPSPEELATLYARDYYVRPYGRGVGDRVRAWFQDTMFWRRRSALLGSAPGRLLEVGCGTGDFLAFLARHGWDVVGTELSADACVRARAQGLTVHQGELAAAKFPDGAFDVVTLWHVLEHLPSPATALAEIQRVLRDDGLLIIEVPNSACLTFRLCGARWYALDVPRHLQHFTPETLTAALHRAGFAPVHRQHWHHWDFTFTVYSVMNRLGLLHRLGIHSFSGDYQEASRATRALFLLVGLPVALGCLPWALLTTLCTGQGETVTITARKDRPSRLRPPATSPPLAHVSRP